MSLPRPAHTHTHRAEGLSQNSWGRLTPSKGFLVAGNGTKQEPVALRPSVCSAHSYVKRMKEFERERRLLRRKKRREQREKRVAQGQGEGEVGPEMAL